ncbi:HPP family protein [Rouxiella sp. Mn2063]|uniref:HPP family protein n=1 Tax=Rouxiella sp. Mn2063 TaxID=3395262 RepID=UPI003BE375AD
MSNHSALPSITVSAIRNTRLRNAFFGFVGGGIAITLLGLLAKETHQLLLIAPFGASSVLLFALPESPLAQPRNLVFGHLLCAAIGLLILWLLGDGFWQTGLAVGLAIALMQLTSTLHPPAGANPVLIMLVGQVHWSFLLTPILGGTLILLFTALCFNNLTSDHNWPKRW